jgi:hypothetical protein
LASYLGYSYISMATREIHVTTEIETPRSAQYQLALKCYRLLLGWCIYQVKFFCPLKFGMWTFLFK